MLRREIPYFILLFVALTPGFVNAAENVEPLLSQLRAVEAEGKGNVEAGSAFAKLIKHNSSVLIDILQAFEGANPLAVNWLWNAFDTIAAETLKSGNTLPNAELEKFLLDKSQNARARRLAYEWLKRSDPSAEDRLIPGMLHDPSSEMRRDAVTRLLAHAEKLKKAKKSQLAIPIYQQALSGAFDDDQVKTISKALKQLKKPVNIQEHFGFISQWKLIGPFDNKEKIGFAAVYPPEKKIDLQAEYTGQLGKVKWKDAATDDAYGIIDIAKLDKNYKGSVTYAYAEFQTAKALDVELRLGIPNAWKVWVNGKELFAREEYHRGMKVDQYRVPAKFKAGKNSILLKVCQNKQTQSWAQRYRFQLRVCKSSGIAVHSKTKHEVSLN